MAYHFATHATDSSETLEDMIDSNEATLEKLMRERDDAVAEIEQVTAVLGQLREDLASQLMAEVKEFMGRWQLTDGTWSVLHDEKSFDERLHKSFDWIGRMLQYTMADWGQGRMGWTLTERGDLYDRLRGSLDEFMDWFEGPGPQQREYRPAVAACGQLRETLASAEAIVRQHQNNAECVKTLQRLQRDVDEIVGHITDKMREDNITDKMREGGVQAVTTQLTALKALYSSDVQMSARFWM